MNTGGAAKARKLHLAEDRRPFGRTARARPRKIRGNKESTMRRAVYLAALTLAALANGCLTGPTAGGSKTASSGKTSGEPGTLFHNFESDAAKNGGVWTAEADSIGSKANFELK